MLSIILRCAFASGTIFCQELPGKFDLEAVPEGDDFVVNEKETAVIWDSQHFHGPSDGLRAIDTKIKRLMERVEGKTLQRTGRALQNFNG